MHIQDTVFNNHDRLLDHLETIRNYNEPPRDATWEELKELMERELVEVDVDPDLEAGSMWQVTATGEMELEDGGREL